MNNQQTREFLMSYRRLTDSGCWEFTGYCSPGGYGQLTIHQVRWGVHRLMYTLEHGPIPDGMLVLHSCDNPPCFNPEHLRVGTQAENVQDSILRGRHGLTNGKPYSTVGSAVPWVCVNDHDMRDPKNVYVSPKGQRQCRRCRTEAVARSHARRKAKCSSNDGETKHE